MTLAQLQNLAIVLSSVAKVAPRISDRTHLHDFWVYTIGQQEGLAGTPIIHFDFTHSRPAHRIITGAAFSEEGFDEFKVYWAFTATGDSVYLFYRGSVISLQDGEIVDVYRVLRAKPDVRLALKEKQGDTSCSLCSPFSEFSLEVLNFFGPHSQIQPLTTLFDGFHGLWTSGQSVFFRTEDIAEKHFDTAFRISEELGYQMALVICIDVTVLNAKEMIAALAKGVQGFVLVAHPEIIGRIRSTPLTF